MDKITLTRGQGEVAHIRTEELDMWLAWGWVPADAPKPKARRAPKDE